MNISEVREQVTGASYEEELAVLEQLSDCAGDSAMTGYLNHLSSISFDREGKLEFESQYLVSDLETSSRGAVLNDSIVIKQVQKNKEQSYYQLFSWQKDGSSFSYIRVNSLPTLDFLYERTKLFHQEPFVGDFSNDLLELGISLEHVVSAQSDCKRPHSEYSSSREVSEPMKESTPPAYIH